MTERELAGATEYIKDRLYYVTLRASPRKGTGHFYFSVDNSLVYWNFFLDFGPLNLGQLFRFCVFLRDKLETPRLSKTKIYFYSDGSPQHRTNAVCLLASYGILYMGLSPEEAFKPFINIRPSLLTFEDATPVHSTYHLSVLDCLRGLERAKHFSFFNYDTFDVDEYEHYEKVENGDFNWICDGKFLAFAGPHNHRERHDGYSTLTPEDYTPYFKKKGIERIIRLNKKYYDASRFTNAGFEHSDIYYLDGSNPPMHLLEKFIEHCEATRGGIAVHCKAGLGRTGTCIGAYMMKHYRMTAAEVIGWFRIARPGSVIGPQQHFMEAIQDRMWDAGDNYRKRHGIKTLGTLAYSSSSGESKSSKNNKIIEMYDPTLSEESKSYHDPGQGDKLRSAKSSPLSTSSHSRGMFSPLTATRY